MADANDVRQLLVFTLAHEQYALPIKQIQEIVRYTPPRSVAASSHDVCGVLSLRGQIIPIYDLAARLGTRSEISERSRIVIVDTGTQTVGMIVDGVDEVLTVQEDQIDQAPASDATLVESIAKIDQRLVVLLNTCGVFGPLAAAA